jgi:hypothetical protein
MSVGLLIEYSDASMESSWTPVATQAVFATYWVPAAHLLGLEWVPLFETGTSVDNEDVSRILEELALLKRWVTSDPPELAKGLAGEIADRIDRFAAELEAVRHIPGVEIFIG